MSPTLCHIEGASTKRRDERNAEDDRSLDNRESLLQPRAAAESVVCHHALPFGLQRWHSDNRYRPIANQRLQCYANRIRHIASPWLLPNGSKQLIIGSSGAGCGPPAIPELLVRLCERPVGVSLCPNRSWPRTNPARLRNERKGRASIPPEQRLSIDWRDAAQYLSISLRSLNYLLAHGELHVRRIGSRVLIPLSELQRYAWIDHPSESPAKESPKRTDKRPISMDLVLHC